MKKIGFLIILTFFIFSTLSASNVKLIRANSFEGHYQSYHWQCMQFDVVTNQISDPTVQVHYKMDSNTFHFWNKIYLKKGLGENLWHGEFCSHLISNLTLYVEAYDTNQKKSYWDNNGGQNYNLLYNEGSYLVNQNIFLHSLIPPNEYINSFRGVITLKNIAPAKKVTVVYSLDNWRTVQTVQASYDPYFWYYQRTSIHNPNMYGFEEWSFSIPIDTKKRTQKISFALSYEVEGETYWDNNLGRNYHAELTNN